LPPAAIPIAVDPSAVPVAMIAPAPAAIAPAPVPVAPVAVAPMAPAHLRHSAVVGGDACGQRCGGSGLRGRRGHESHCGDEAGKDSLSHVNLLGCERTSAVFSRLKHDGGSAARKKSVRLNQPEQIVRIFICNSSAIFGCA